MGHVASNYSKVRIQWGASWWKDSKDQHYTVLKNVDGGEKQKSFSQIVTESPQGISLEVTNVSPKWSGKFATEGGKIFL